ncbi:hypothetical protein BJX65DRAFT_282710 [Aspergillus insuetus]
MFLPTISLLVIPLASFARLSVLEERNKRARNAISITLFAPYILRGVSSFKASVLRRGIKLLNMLHGRDVLLSGC